MDIRVSDDPAADAARWIARRLRDSVRRRGDASLAVSGGSTAPPMFAALQGGDVPWAHLTLWQVDERIAPDGSTDRNAGQLTGFPARVRAMPVTANDGRRAARRYAASLPERFDVIHLGIGGDGHTASWPPGDDAVMTSDRAVELTGPFHGRARMTLTPSVVNAARARVVLVTGAGKAGIVRRWLLRDSVVPITRVRSTGTFVFLDPRAASALPL